MDHRVCRQVIQAWLLLEGESVFEVVFSWVDGRDVGDKMRCILLHRVRLILLSDIVMTIAEGRLPVLLVKVVVIIYVLGARTWCGIAISERCADVTRDTVPIVTTDTPFHRESLPPVFPDEPYLLQSFFYHL